MEVEFLESKLESVIREVFHLVRMDDEKLEHVSFDELGNFISYWMNKKYSGLISYCKGMNDNLRLFGENGINPISVDDNSFYLSGDDLFDLVMDEKQGFDFIRKTIEANKS